MLDGKFVDAKTSWPRLPKKDLITMMAVGIKQVLVARATKGVPSNIISGVKAIADGKSDIIQAKTVAVSQLAKAFFWG